MHYLLIYDLAPDYLARRAALRNDPLRLAWEAHARGELVLGGALDEPVDPALLLFDSDSAQVAERFAASDPYVINGLVTRWLVRPWRTVVGDDASTPVRPDWTRESSVTRGAARRTSLLTSPSSAPTRARSGVCRPG